MCCFEGLKVAILILCERTQRTDVTPFRLSWDLAPVRKRRQTNQGRANWALKRCVISAIDDGAICHVDRFALCFNTADNTSMFLRRLSCALRMSCTLVLGAEMTAIDPVGFAISRCSR